MHHGYPYTAGGLGTLLPVAQAAMRPKGYEIIEGDYCKLLILLPLKCHG